MSWIDCTHTVHPDMIQWPTDFRYEREQVRDMRTGDDYNLSVLRTGVHVGTHIDAPRHFTADGMDIAAIPLELLVGQATVVEIREKRHIEAEDLDGVDSERVLFRTANQALWQRQAFSKDFVALTVPAAERLIETGIRLVGIDYASVDAFEASECPVHRLLAGAGVVVIENIDLARVPAGRYELVALPSKLADAEGAPARVMVRPLP